MTMISRYYPWDPNQNYQSTDFITSPGEFYIGSKENYQYSNILTLKGRSIATTRLGAVVFMQETLLLNNKHWVLIK